MLVNAGFHSSGNQVLYNGMTGEQLYSDIYIGPTYYMRLKHMVKDKINYRARGPRTMLTRQTVQGRANDGGLRIGEMERDGVLAHGASAFLNESFMIRGDEYYMAVCNKTGGIAIYNNSQNLFLSPFADGPIKFNSGMDGKMNIQQISRFGRSFSVVRVPYALKLLIQELQTMNIQMRIITEDNIDQLLNLSYSNNVNLLLNDDTENITELATNYSVKYAKRKETEKKEIEDKKKQDDAAKLIVATPDNASPKYASPKYASPEEAYKPTKEELEELEPDSEPFKFKDSFIEEENGASKLSLIKPVEDSEIKGIKIKNPEVKSEFDALPEREKIVLMKMMAEMKNEKKKQKEIDNKDDKNPISNKTIPVEKEDSTSILKVEEEKKEESENENSGDTKSVSISDDTKKIVI
jgi:DNA-directed RNA polymerase II subunit RPB2